LAAFQRLAPTLGARIAELAGDDAWVLIGGTPEWARIAGAALPRQLEGRVLVSTTLDHDAPGMEIASAAKHAASELRAAQGGALVDRLMERAGAHGRAAAGMPAVQRALEAQAVDLLLVSPDFVRDRDCAAEEAVRAAIAQGADVEVLSGDAGAQLGRAAEGIAARLRFAPSASLSEVDSATGAEGSA
jgi:peptide subunit release factor 1 (eRF1)